jgi:hypothetical protein
MNRLNPNAPEFKPKSIKKTESVDFDVGDVFDTPKDYYLEQDQIDDTQDNFYNLKFKTSNGRHKVFNPYTNRWIINTGSNRKRIESKQRTLKKKVTFRKQPIVEEFVVDVIQPPDVEYPDGLTLEACSIFKRNLPIDLNKIRPGKENQKVEIDWGKSDKKILPGTLEYDGIPLNYITYISRGSFGTVFKYSNAPDTLPDGWTKNKSRSNDKFYYFNESLGKTQWNRPVNLNDRHYQVAVKTYNDPNDTEISLVNELEANGKRGVCNLINSTILKLKYYFINTNVSVMDIMDGTLSNLIDTTSIPDKIEILKRIIDHFVCLKQKISENTNYTDLKCDNILYKCFTNKKMKICIGDIGGLCNGWNGSSTYPAPEFLNGNGNCTIGTLIWGMGVTFLELLGYNTLDVFYWKPAKKMSKNEFQYKCVKETEKAIQQYKLNEIFVKNTPFSYILMEMLHPFANERISLSKLKDVLENGLPEHNQQTVESGSSEDGF